MPADNSQGKKPTEDDVLNKPEEEKNLDRDGGERQPTDQSEAK